MKPESLDDLRDQMRRDPEAHAAAWFQTETNTAEAAAAAERIADRLAAHADAAHARYEDFQSYLLSDPFKSVKGVEKVLRHLRLLLVLAVLLLAVIAVRI